MFSLNSKKALFDIIINLVNVTNDMRMIVDYKLGMSHVILIAERENEF